MSTLFTPMRGALLLALLVGATACERLATPDAATPPPTAAPTPSVQAAVTLGEGFYKEETIPQGALAWVHQDSALSIQVPVEGRYRVTFHPVTVFSSVENTIGVTVGGQPAGKVSTHACDLANPAAATVEVNLRPGGNELRLHADRPEVKLAADDARTVSFGLVLPVGVEKVP